MTRSIRLLWSSPRICECHTYCRVVTTCFIDLGLSRLGFEHPTIRFLGERLGMFLRLNLTGQSILFVCWVGLSVLSMPPCHFLFYFMRKLGIHGPIILCIKMNEFISNCSWNSNPWETKWIATTKQTLKCSTTGLLSPNRHSKSSLGNISFVQPFFLIFLQVAINDCIASFELPSPYNISIPP